MWVSFSGMVSVMSVVERCGNAFLEIVSIVRNVYDGIRRIARSAVEFTFMLMVI